MVKKQISSLFIILVISLVGIFVASALENVKFSPLTPDPKLDIAAVEAIFTNKAEYNYIEATKRFTLSLEMVIQYFEVVLQAKYNTLPIEISLAGDGHHFAYSPPNMAVGDHVGGGIVQYRGKFYLFFTHEKEISIVDILDKSDKRYKNGLRPLVAIKGRGTQVLVRKECAYLPSMRELDQKIVEYKVQHLSITNASPSAQYQPSTRFANASSPAQNIPSRHVRFADENKPPTQTRSHSTGGASSSAQYRPSTLGGASLSAHGHHMERRRQ